MVMNPLILSLIGLVTVGVSANLIKLIRKNKILLLIAIIPCIYIFIYGLYATFGPIDLYKDGTENFIAQNPGKELPVVFVLLKFYQYILILVGAIFGLIYFNYFKNFNQTMESSDYANTNILLEKL
jgi:uncharacterized membrane protein